MNEQELNKAVAWIDENVGTMTAIAFRKAMTDKTNPLFEKCLADVNPETRNEVRRNMDYADWTEKACEFLEERLYPTVKVQNEDLVDVIDRWELIDEFRKAMGAITPVLTWQDVRKIWEAGMALADYNTYHNIPIEDEAFYNNILKQFQDGCKQV